MKSIIALLFGLSLLLPLTVSAQGFKAPDLPNEDGYKIVSLTSEETVDDDYFAAGQRVEVSGTVNGDVYVVGGQVVIDGTVNGDVLAAGGTIILSGKVSQDVRLAGGNVTVTGRVGRNLSVVGGNITVTKEAVLANNLVVGGGNVDVFAPVTGSVRAAAGNLNIANKVGGDLEAGVGQLRILSEGAVTGDVTYWSEKDAVIAPEASVSGQVQKNEVKTPEINRREAQAAASGFNFFSALVSMTTTIALGLLLLYFYPRFSTAVAETINQRGLFSLGVGFLALVITPILAVTLMITILGIPLGIILLFIYFIVLYLSRIFVMLWIGSKVLKNASVYVSFIVGVVLYYIVGIIPVIGGLMKFIVLLIGFGAFLLTKINFYGEYRKKELV